jgi:hypothetical protein
MEVPGLLVQREMVELVQRGMAELGFLAPQEMAELVYQV